MRTHIKHIVQGDERITSASSSVCVEFLAALNEAFEWSERIPARGKAVLKNCRGTWNSLSLQILMFIKFCNTYTDMVSEICHKLIMCETCGRFTLISILSNRSRVTLFSLLPLASKTSNVCREDDAYPPFAVCCDCVIATTTTTTVSTCRAERGTRFRMQRTTNKLRLFRIFLSLHLLFYFSYNKSVETFRWPFDIFTSQGVLKFLISFFFVFLKSY